MRRLNEKQEEIIALCQQLAESQAYAEMIHGALEELACLGNGDRHGNSIGNSIAIKALSIHHDRTALDAAIKAAKVEALRAAAEYFSEGTNDITAFQLERMAKEIEDTKND
jgi:hypothetical protein